MIVDEANSVLQLNYNGLIKGTFMTDATEVQFKRALNNMVSEPAKIGIEILHYPEKLFLSLPKFYVEATDDKIISHEARKKYKQRLCSKKCILYRLAIYLWFRNPKC